MNCNFTIVLHQCYNTIYSKKKGVDLNVIPTPEWIKVEVPSNGVRAGIMTFNDKFWEDDFNRFYRLSMTLFDFLRFSKTIHDSRDNDF